MDPEISSFILKFQNLCWAGKEAKLTFTSKNGNTNVNLSLQLGNLPPSPQFHPHHFPPRMHRNEPSRERRRQKREQARKSAAEEASKKLSAKEVELLNMAEKAEENSSKVKSKNAETVKVCREPIDKICPDSDYQQETPAVEVDEAELARDILVEKVLVYPVTEPIEKKADVEQEVRERFSEIGVEVKQMDTKITFRGEFKGSVVTISPVKFNRIWGRRLNLKNCSVIHYKA